MGYRKLQYSNVQGSRSTETLGHGVIAVDENDNSLYIGDGSTVGGNPVNAANSVNTITHTANTLASGTNWGDGSDISVSDNSQTEFLTISNSLGALGRASLPIITTAGKMLIMIATDGDDSTLVDYTRLDAGGTQASVQVGDGPTSVAIMISLGSRGWQLIPQS